MGRRKLSIGPLSDELRARARQFPSQRACATAIGISEGTLSGILARLDHPAGAGPTASVRVACRLASFLGHDPCSLYGLAEAPHETAPGGRPSSHNGYRARPMAGAGMAATVNGSGAGHTTRERFRGAPPFGPSVFVSYRFGTADDGTSLERAAGGLIRALREAGFVVTTGQQFTGSIRDGVLDAIRDADYFVQLITPGADSTDAPEGRPADSSRRASTWLIEEKAVAVTLGKKMVLLQDERVEDFGHLHADQQVIRFKGLEIAGAIYEALDLLTKVASGT